MKTSEAISALMAIKVDLSLKESFRGKAMLLRKITKRVQYLSAYKITNENIPSIVLKSP